MSDWGDGYETGLISGRGERWAELEAERDAALADLEAAREALREIEAHDPTDDWFLPRMIARAALGESE